jgi:hypothetical protein
MASSLTMPKIEKGVACPPPLPGERRGRKRSPWRSFLQSLEIGDSFLVEYRVAQNVKTIARNLGIELVWRYAGKGTDDLYYERIWRVDR